MKHVFIGSTVLCAMLATAGLAGAQVKVGVIVSATGPAASLGIPEKNTVGLCAKSIGGKTVEFIVLDEASDTTTAVQNAKKLIGENKVDAIIGSTTTPTTLADNRRHRRRRDADDLAGVVASASSSRSTPRRRGCSRRRRPT